MTFEKAQAVRQACDAAGVTGLVCHTSQRWEDASHYVELPVVPPWTLAAWEAEWALRRRWAEEDALAAAELMEADAPMPQTGSLAA